MESSMYIFFFPLHCQLRKKRKKGRQRKHRLSELGGVFLLESPREREIFMGLALALPACNRNNEKRDCHFFCLIYGIARRTYGQAVLISFVASHSCHTRFYISVD